MTHDTYPDSFIRGILNTVKTIAMVGISPKDNRPSYFAFKYLQERGYRMIPVNPGQAGKEILGQKVYATPRRYPGAGRHGRYLPRLSLRPARGPGSDRAQTQAAGDLDAA